MMIKFIHLSDLHFHRSDKNNQEAIETLEYIENNYPQHYLILTGDIVDDANEKQYKRAFKALKPFKGKSFICPGNHDFGVAGNFFDKDLAKNFDKMLSGPLDQKGTFLGKNMPVVNKLNNSSDKVILIALDTNLETRSILDFACGKVGHKQLTALDNILSQSSSNGTTSILFFHHHLFCHSDRFLCLRDADKLKKIINGRVDIVLFGHKHVSGLWEPHQEIPHIPHVLASDNSPGKKTAREITVKNGKITVADLPIS